MVWGRITSARTHVVSLMFSAFVGLALLGGCANRAQLIYRRAEIFFGRGEYEMAIAEYERIVQDYPNDPIADDALYKLGHLYRVHLNQPGRSLANYRKLAQEYPNSPYADDSLLWCVRICARDMRLPSQAASMCAELDKRFPDRNHLRARAHMEVAKAFLAAGEKAQARQEIQVLRKEFANQPEVAAAADLMLANLAEAEGAKKDEIAALLETVVKTFPNTHAAQEAQRRLGMMYYVQRKADQKQREEEMRREACWLSNVPAFQAWSDPRLTMLDGLRALLKHSGFDAPLPVLAAAAGWALLPVADISRDAWPKLWEHDPLVALAETCGMTPSVWVAQKSEAWEAARRTLARGQPALVAYSPGRWVILAGWQPQQKQVGVLEPGGQLTARSLSAFLDGWRPAPTAAPFIAFPENAYYVFTISGRRKTVTESALRRAATQALENLLLSSTELSVLKPVEVARQAALLLSRASGDSNPVLNQWSDTKLRRWAEVRRVLADFLQPADPRCADAARHIADVIGSLRQAILSAANAPSSSRDYQAAASYADRLAAEEDNFEQSLAQFITSSEGGA